MADLSDLSQGTLSDLESTLTGFERRPTQEEFVELWASAIERHRDVAIEAPTGSGKSFGYLVPAIQSGKRVVVATRSIALQNQLIHKDLPTLNRVLATSWALAKGYGNFACKLKLGERTRSLPLEPTAVEALESWAQTTEAGERDEAFSRLAPELGTQPTREAWRSIQASPDDCIKSHCSFYEDCFYFRHRAHWDQAQVIVCNHHLLLYGLITSLLPPAELLVIDEAYVDFAETDALPLVRERENVVVLRTLSKGYSLAGLRVGFAVAQPAVLEGLSKTKQIYNVGALPAALAAASMRDQEWKNANAERIKASRADLTAGLERLGWRVWPSQANFVLARPPSGNAAEVHDALRRRGILVRHFATPRLADKLRITVGTPEENAALMEAVGD